jgi:hypothetical protein
MYQQRGGMKRIKQNETMRSDEYLAAKDETRVLDALVVLFPLDVPFSVTPR